MSQEPRRTLTLLPERRNGDANLRSRGSPFDWPFWRGLAFGVLIYGAIGVLVFAVCTRAAHAQDAYTPERTQLWVAA